MDIYFINVIVLGIGMDIEVKGFRKWGYELEHFIDVFYPIMNLLAYFLQKMKVK